MFTPSAPPVERPVPVPTSVHEVGTVPILPVNNLPVPELPIPVNLDEHQPTTKKKCAVKGCPSFVSIVLIETCSREKMVDICDGT